MKIRSITEEDIVTTYNNMNLIPIINPSLTVLAIDAIELMLNYRIQNTTEVDSSMFVKNCYKLCYGKDIPDKADTILNALTPLKTFCIFRLKEIGGNVYPFSEYGNGWIIRHDLLNVMLDNLKTIFDGYDELKVKFNRFSDLMYCFANLMPAPKGYNAFTDSDGNHMFGKGTYKENNDYPWFYLKNLQNGRDSEMLLWLNNNMKKYHLQEAFQLQPPFTKPDEYYDDNKYEKLMEYLDKAIQVIENRAKWLFEGGKNDRK